MELNRIMRNFLFFMQDAGLLRPCRRTAGTGALKAVDQYDHAILLIFHHSAINLEQLLLPVFFHHTENSAGKGGDDGCVIFQHFKGAFLSGEADQFDFSLIYYFPG